MGDLSAHDLEKYINTFNLNTFVETGTGTGYGLSHALNFNFRKLYSIEFMEPLFKECKSKFIDPRVNLLNCNSIEGLEKISKELEPDSRVLYWLDAHFPGADFHLNDYSYLSTVKELYLPLEFELTLLFSLRDTSKDVFLIDDLRIYEDGPYEFGNWNERNSIPNLNLNHITSIVEKTHSISKDMRQQGFLILTPK